MTGPGGLPGRLTTLLLESALEGELTERRRGWVPGRAGRRR